ncbi:hypothetical protein P691DRAFT_412574 [Macrolepiota fuliginosa MF-IS2]|uniref:Uncharacterized protein n=1 Tax=Macrolepiota fuliginosa MF-IS2 TaxID=1400762 RepID=A0A9P5X4Z2_9AGAR|nr:hypothetical protein P691DRAFT_412574 [Macrolepiota fuliginosa MF-IS2]
MIIYITAGGCSVPPERTAQLGQRITRCRRFLGLNQRSKLRDSRQHLLPLPVFHSSSVPPLMDSYNHVTQATSAAAQPVSLPPAKHFGEDVRRPSKRTDRFS